MKLSCCSLDRTRVAAYFVAVAGTFLILGGLAWFVLQRTRAPGIDQARAAERRKFLAEVRAADRLALETYGWIDPAKGIVRLPLQRALELSLAMANDPAAARSNLVARSDKASARPPEKPNEYE
jgi:hypothetical protein